MPTHKNPPKKHKVTNHRRDKNKVCARHKLTENIRKNPASADHVLKTGVTHAQLLHPIWPSAPGRQSCGVNDYCMNRRVCDAVEVRAIKPIKSCQVSGG